MSGQQGVSLDIGGHMSGSGVGVELGVELQVVL